MSLFDASDHLDLKDSAYKKAVKRYVWQSYLDDLGRKGDITTKLFVKKPGKFATAEVVVKEKGVLCGMLEAEWLMDRLGLKVLDSRKEGEILTKGSVAMRIQGSADKILKVERTILNLLQRMSGIATKTNSMRNLFTYSIELLATRKTLWGPLDKRAVVVGGGSSHRLNLSDAVLVKENHRALSDNLEKSFKKVLKSVSKTRFIEIELESFKEAQELYVQIISLKLSPRALSKIAIMLDDFDLKDIKKVVTLYKKLKIQIEVSGGIDESNVKKYALPGIHAISSGSITNKAPALDFSLQIL